MIILLGIYSILATSGIALMAILQQKNNTKFQLLKASSSSHAADLEALKAKYEKDTVRLTDLEKSNSSLESTLVSKSEEIESLKSTIKFKDDMLENKNATITDLEKDKSAFISELEEKTKYFAKYEEDKKKMMEIFANQSKATLSEISSQMIEKSANSNKELHEKIVRQINEVSKEFEVVSSKVRDQGGDVTKLLNTLMSPTKAGVQGEVILENTLKAQGLKPGIDYITQYSCGNGGSARPDCVLFMPDDVVFVIDSKSGVFIQEDSEPDIKKITANMNEQLKKLSQTSYKTAVKDQIAKDRGLSLEQKERIRIVLFMFVPSESILGNIQSEDPNFIMNARQKNIVLCGPTSVQYIVLFAAAGIKGFRQSQRHAQIMSNVKEFVNRFGTMYDYLRSFNKSFTSATKHWNDAAKSIEKRFMPQMREVSNSLSDLEPKKQEVINSELDEIGKIEALSPDLFTKEAS